ncbi:protein of unknown function [Blastococcus saxobsidens DD2]|uniref:Uncharacterized protein n=1 Tax=Blastococcus saxobsidens (strain DD2) TaxID=1146883 RepID=H6RQ85_BLASD|nr:protein of unknown function [Blastococcus saxobsidens DD2]
MGPAQVVGVGKVDFGGTHLVELLTRPWSRPGDVDDVEDFWAAEAGDLHGTHAGQAMAYPVAAAVPRECARWPTRTTGPVSRETLMVLGCN